MKEYSLFLWSLSFRCCRLMIIQASLLFLRKLIISWFKLRVDAFNFFSLDWFWLYKNTTIQRKNISNIITPIRIIVENIHEVFTGSIMDSKLFVALFYSISKSILRQIISKLNHVCHEFINNKHTDEWYCKSCKLSHNKSLSSFFIHLSCIIYIFDNTDGAVKMIMSSKDVIFNPYIFMYIDYEVYGEL